jgi:hypothetical protein
MGGTDHETPCRVQVGPEILKSADEHCLPDGHGNGKGDRPLEEWVVGSHPDAARRDDPVNPALRT